jgi:hypothetical protein
MAHRASLENMHPSRARNSVARTLSKREIEERIDEMLLGGELTIQRRSDEAREIAALGLLLLPRMAGSASVWRSQHAPAWRHTRRASPRQDSMNRLLSQNGQDSQGLKSTTPICSKSLTFRVTKVRSCSRAVAARSPSIRRAVCLSAVPALKGRPSDRR